MRSGMAAVFLAILLAAFAGCGRSHLHRPALPDAAGGADAAAGAATDAAAGAATDAATGACMPETERCNAVDDDCDGMVDESLSRPCGSDVGACKAGTQRCQEGTWASCIGAVQPRLENCNAVDDDCDGKLDEALMRPCGSTVGACEAGAEACSDGSWHSCTASGPAMEACDGMLDEDCDGTVDEGCDCVAGTTRPCGSDLGACKAGSQLCEAGAWAACQDAVHPSLERCNGVDDDCDGKLDEALMRPCGSDVGVCQAGSESCAAGAWVDCSAIGPDPERCNDLDDDCDGVVDESLACRPCEQRITAGWSHTCARDGTGQVWCWGGNSWDELGGPIGAHSSLPLASNVMDSLEIRAGRSHTCARLRSGGVRCWGRDSESQLGDSSLGNLPAVELTLGSGHTCARLITGEVWCWGANSVGELGDGSRTHPRAMPRAVSGLADAAAIKAGIAHTCALLQTGEVRCWGFNPSAQLGNTLPGSTKPVTVAGLGRAVELAASEHDTCALLATGEVWCWGGFYGPVPVAVAGLQDVVEIKAGRQHTCARLLGGELRCWGANYRAQLGDGTTLDRRVPGPVPGVRGAVELTLGWMHTCARLGNGELWCWGSNHQGQLGDGTTTQRTSPVLVQGLRLPACSP